LNRKLKKAREEKRKIVEELVSKEAPLRELQSTMKAATAARIKSAKLLEELDFGEGEKAFDEALRESRIIRAIYWGGGVTGRDSWRMMECREIIFTRLASKLKAIKKDGVDDEYIDEILAKYKSLLESFYPICRIMRSVEKQSDDTIAKLVNICTAFGLQWRATIRRVPHKVHLVESHLADQLRQLRCTGLFSEDPIERLHHTQLVQLRRWSNIRDYQDLEEHIDKVSAAAKTAAVTAIKSEVEMKTKRRFSEKAIQRMKDREMVVEAAKNRDIDNILQKYNNAVV
jgi:hypothetical protein